MKRHYEHAGTVSAGMEPEGALMAGSGVCQLILGEDAIIVEDFEEEYFDDYTF